MLVRVAEPNKLAFQLRKGEEGLSLFDTDAVDPSLTEGEILEAFREGSVAIYCSRATVEHAQLQLVAALGSESLPERLRLAHFEVRPGPNMTRPQFKTALKELERNENA
jgi:hypothetical protein